MWGDIGPYSQVNLIIQTRILDDKISRIFLIVEANINPLTYEIVLQNRSKFKDDIMIQQLLDRADYRGQEFGYVVSAFEEEFTDKSILEKAQQRLEYAKDNLIKMHKFAMDLLDIKIKK